MNRTGKILLALVAIVLVAAVGLGVRSRLLGQQEIAHAGILAKIPRTFAGWTVEELKVADSPEMQRAVDEMLNYDEAVLRTFKRGDRELTVYAAYWRPRKYPARFVAQHTPEVCWPANGWKLISADYNVPFLLPHNLRALPVQQPVFDQKQGKICYVRYWHVSGHELSGFASGPASHSIFIGDAFWRDLQISNVEQMFVRLSTNRPWQEWTGDDLLNEILTVLSPVLADAGTKT